MTVDERRLTTALQFYARELVVTDIDLDRLEERLDERLTPVPHRHEGHRAWEWAAAACAVVALVLAVTALWRTRAEQATPATPTITAADLAGMWAPESAVSEWMWHFSADGRLAFTSTASAYVNRYGQTTFTLQGDLLSFPDQGQVCRSTVRLSVEGRLALIPVRGPAVCSLFALEDDALWRFIRVSPASLHGATLTVRTLDRARRPSLVKGITDVVGTWLLRGTGTTLAIVRTSPGVGKYVIDDDGDGMLSPDQRGRIMLRPDGGVVLRPEGGAQEVCETVYSGVVTTGATLEASVDDASCGQFGARRDTWIRLN